MMFWDFFWKSFRSMDINISAFVTEICILIECIPGQRESNNSVQLGFPYFHQHYNENTEKSWVIFRCKLVQVSFELFLMNKAWVLQENPWKTPENSHGTRPHEGSVPDGKKPAANDVIFRLFSRQPSIFNRIFPRKRYGIRFRPLLREQQEAWDFDWQRHVTKLQIWAFEICHPSRSTWSFVLRYLLRDKETKVAMESFVFSRPGMATWWSIWMEVSPWLFPHVITIVHLFKSSISNFGSYSSFFSNKNIWILVNHFTLPNFFSWVSVFGRWRNILSMGFFHWISLWSPRKVSFPSKPMIFVDTPGAHLIALAEVEVPFEPRFLEQSWRKKRYKVMVL